MVLFVWRFESLFIIRDDVVEDESSDIGSTRVLASKLAGERTSHIC